MQPNPPTRVFEVHAKLTIFSLHLHTHHTHRHLISNLLPEHGTHAHCSWPPSPMHAGHTHHLPFYRATSLLSHCNANPLMTFPSKTTIFNFFRKYPIVSWVFQPKTPLHSSRVPDASARDLPQWGTCRQRLAGLLQEAAERSSRRRLVPENAANGAVRVRVGSHRRRRLWWQRRWQRRRCNVVPCMHYENGPRPLGGWQAASLYRRSLWLLMGLRVIFTKWAWAYDGDGGWFLPSGLGLMMEMEPKALLIHIIIINFNYYYYYY